MFYLDCPTKMLNIVYNKTQMLKKHLKHILIAFMILNSSLVLAQRNNILAQIQLLKDKYGLQTKHDSDLVSYVTNLTYELKYGVAVKNMNYNGLKMQIDSGSVNKIANRLLSESSMLSLLQPRFPKYNQLLDYYQTSDSSLVLKEKIAQTLNFYRWLNRFQFDKMVIVNIPAAQLVVIDSLGNTLLKMKIIVGAVEHQTPSFAAYITQIITYPYWNVPRSIATKELLPKIKKNLGVLADQNFQVLDRDGAEVDPYTIDWKTLSVKNFPYTLRQATGCDNALGVMKFNINSIYDVYLHDTNSRGLFSRQKRFLSHGCMRVEQPVELANLLLNETRFDQSFLTTCLIDASPKTIRLSKNIPIAVVYQLVDVDDSGKLVEWLDVYKW